MEDGARSDISGVPTMADITKQALSRRRFTVLAGAFLGTSLLAACGGDDDDDDGGSDQDPTEPSSAEDDAESTATEAEGAAPSASEESEDAPTATTSGDAPTRGGTLVYATNLDSQTLDPHFSSQLADRYALYLIYNTLVAYDVDFNIVPDLAASWEVSDDGMTITFQLRENVTFHDGTPCDSEAVKWNLDRVMDVDVNSPLRSQLAVALENVEVIDPTTVQLNLTQPWRPLLAALGERPGFIVSPSAVEQYGEEYGLNPVGSGPFRFVEWVQDSHLALERSDDYFDADKTYLDRIEMRHVPEEQVRITMIRTGEAHVIDRLTAGLLPTIEGADGVEVVKTESARIAFTRAYMDRPPFDNVDLRNALAYGTNREEVNRVIYGGTGRIATHPIGGGWAYDPSLDGEHFPYDPDKAREHLALSGFEGETLTYTDANTQTSQQISVLLQAMYQELGLSIELETVEAADKFPLIYEGTINWSSGSWAPRADPDGTMRVLWHSQGAQNSTGYNNPEFDRLIDEAATVYDPAEAAALYQQAERLLAEDAIYQFHVYTAEFAARRENVQGFVVHPDLILRFRGLSLKS